MHFRLIMVMPCSYQERALPTELCGQVCTKSYCKSILGIESTKYGFPTLEHDAHVQLAD